MFMHEGEEESRVLSIIKELMEELAGKMEYSSDDFEERLGRKKPEVEVSVIKGEMPGKAMEDVAEMSPMDDMEEDEGEEDYEGDELKNRLMRLRKG